MKVVMVAKRPPTRSAHGGDGDANIACAAIDEIVRRGHELTVLSFVDEHAGRPDRIDGVTHLQFPARSRRAALLRYPLHRMSPPAWQRLVPEAVEALACQSADADVALLHGISTFGLLPHVTCPVVVHEIDPMSMSQREEADLDAALNTAGARMNLLRSAPALLRRAMMRQAASDYERLERLAAERAKTYVVVTEQDASDLGRLLGRRVESVPLGYARREVGADALTRRRTADLAFVGALNFAPNRHALVSFLDDVVDPLRRRLGDLRVVVAGRRADQEIVDLCRGRAALISDPDDLTAVMADARVCVFTNTFGRGERCTVREALAEGTPVAGYPWALRNIPTGPHATVAERGALVESIHALLTQATVWTAATQSACAVTSTMPTWPDVSARLVDRLEEAAVFSRLVQS